MECRGEGLEEALVGCGDAVVDLVAACPECVASGSGEDFKAEAGVVGWLGLECYVGVPTACVLCYVIY